MLNVGVIGLGVGARHVRAYERNPDCRVAAACDLSAGVLREFEAAHPGVRTTDRPEDILEDNGIQLVSIASYDDAHAAQVEAALARGKHVFVEKPLCLFPEEAARIRRLLKARPDLRLSSNLNLRTCPRFQKLKDRVAQGELGDLFYLEADYLWGRKEKITDGWRGRMNYYSLVLGASVHMVDLLLWLTGRRPVDVVAQGNRIATRGSGFRFDDFNVMLLRFDDGLAAKVMSSGGCVHPHFHRLRVYGTRETFIHDSTGAARITSSRPGDPSGAVEGDYPAREEKGRIIDSFVESILHPAAAAQVTGDEVFDAMSVCFAAIRALESGERVKIEYL